MILLKKINFTDRSTSLFQDNVEAALKKIQQSTPVSVRIITVSGNVTVEPTDQFIVIKKSANEATTVFLPFVDAGTQMLVKDGKLDAGTYNITLKPASGTIEGAATFVITSNGGSAALFYSGQEWLVI